MLEQAIIGTGSIDDETIAAYVHQSASRPSFGQITFNTRGEWTQPQILTQCVDGSDPAQFDRKGTQVILYPQEFKSGDLIYPFPPDGN